VLGDGWTAVTRDGSLSAHFEHTVVVTRDGCRILTQADRNAPAESGAHNRKGSLSSSDENPVVGPTFRSAGSVR
jgi:hypothetical protein